MLLHADIDDLAGPANESVQTLAVSAVANAVGGSVQIVGTDVIFTLEKASIIAGLDQPWGEVSACTSCGKCVEVCPTGALFRKEDTTAEKHPRAERIRQLRLARDSHEWTNQ